jgi:hypothetical protein
MVSVLRSRINDALRLFQEKCNEREDDSAVDTAYAITPSPATHHLARTYSQDDQRTYFARATRKPNRKGEMNGELQRNT